MYKLIATNKRNTILIIIGFIILIGAISCAFAYAYNDTSIVVWALVISVACALFQYFAASKLATVMTGAKKIEKKDNRRLFNIVENLSLTAGLPTPEIYIINDSAPNAFASGRDPKHALVAATTGLLDIMDDKELTAVMAHELSHVKNYDIRVSTIVFGLVSLIGLLADIGWRMGRYNSRRDSDNRSPLGSVILIITAILAPIVASIAQMAVSREREYLADASAAHLTRYPEGMIAALKKLENHSEPMQVQNPATEAMFINNPLAKKKFLNNLFSTHPPIEKRIERLENGKYKF